MKNLLFVATLVMGLLAIDLRAGLFTKSHFEWSMTDIQLVGSNLYCIVTKEEVVDSRFMQSMQHGTHISSSGHEAALVRYAIVPKNSLKPAAIIRLPKAR